LAGFAQSRVFSGIRSCFCRHKRGTTQPDQAAAPAGARNRRMTLAPNSFVVPTAILRCLRLPSGPGSRHLNSQTSGPPCRSVRIVLPFAWIFLSVPPMRKLPNRTCRHNSGTDCRRGIGDNRNKSRKVIAFLRQ